MYKIRLQRDFFETCNKWPKWQDVHIDIKISSPLGCQPLYINLQQMGIVIRPFCWHQSLVPWGCLSLPRGYIPVLNHEKKKCIKSDFKDIFLNMQQMNEVTRHFYWYQNFVLWGLSASRPGAIYMFKIMKKKLFKIKLQRDFFETCSKWPWWQEVSLDIKFCPLRLSATASGLYTCIKSWKKLYTIRLQREFFGNLQQMTEVTSCSCWHQNFVPKGLSAPALGLYTCIKSWKNLYKIRLQRDFF